MEVVTPYMVECKSRLIGASIYLWGPTPCHRSLAPCHAVHIGKHHEPNEPVGPGLQWVVMGVMFMG